MKTARLHRLIAIMLTVCTMLGALTFYVAAEEATVTLDTSEIEELIAQSEEVVANKDLYVQTFYENYMNVIEEAKKYYRGEHVQNFNQANVDAMADTIRAAYDKLYTLDIGNPLQEVISRFLIEDCQEHLIDPYSIETWTLYTMAVQSAQRILDSGYYFPELIISLVGEVEYCRNNLIKESLVAPLRINSLNYASFQTSYVYNDSTARLAVNTVSSYDIKAVMVFDEYGNLLVLENDAITSAPYNRRKPQEKILYLDIPIDGVVGTHKYTVYAVDSEALCSAVGAICTIEVRER